MKIIACFKAVPDNDSIVVKPDRKLSVGGEYSAGQYDFNAIEAAAQLKAQIPDSTVLALTVCESDVGCTSKIKKAILSRGADEFYSVCDAGLKGADAFYTASVLKSAIEKMGGADLVICGEGSGDTYNQQTGIILGALMEVATLNAVCGIEGGDGFCKVTRALETENEEYEVSYPAVLSVTSDINTPRIASLKEIMAAGKKPSTAWTYADVEAAPAAGSKTLSTLAPEQRDRKRDIVKGEDDEAVAKFYDMIRKSL